MDLTNALINNFGSIVGLIITLSICLIGILRFGIKFDLNTYLEARRKRVRSLAQLECPHIHLSVQDGQFCCQSLFVSPAGTTQWVCQQCGAVVFAPPSEEEFRETGEYYASNFDLYVKKVKRFEKLARKSL